MSHPQPVVTCRKFHGEKIPGATLQTFRHGPLLGKEISVCFLLRTIHIIFLCWPCLNHYRHPAKGCSALLSCFQSKPTRTDLTYFPFNLGRDFVFTVTFCCTNYFLSKKRGEEGKRISNYICSKEPKDIMPSFKWDCNSKPVYCTWLVFSNQYFSAWS